MAGTVEIFLTKTLKLREKFRSDDIMNIDLVDFKKVTSKVLKGEYVDSALVIATLLISARRLLH